MVSVEPPIERVSQSRVSRNGILQNWVSTEDPIFLSHLKIIFSGILVFFTVTPTVRLQARQVICILHLVYTYIKFVKINGVIFPFLIKIPV